MKKIVVLLSLLISPAFADDARKVNFLAVLTDADGKPLSECVKPDDKGECAAGAERREITLGMLSMRALVIPERDLAPEQSFLRGQLALAVYKSPGLSLTAEEMAMLKKQIAKWFSPLYVVRAFPLIDPATK